jgi:hypothetical protein
MQYDLGFFDEETCRLGSAENPFGAKVLPMCPEWTHAGRDSNLRPSGWEDDPQE